MTVNLDDLAAIYLLSRDLATVDGDATEEEISPLWEFLQSFGEMNQQVLEFITDLADKMEPEEAMKRVSNLEPSGKKQVSNLFAKIICADGELSSEEQEIYDAICSSCDLPEPDQPVERHKEEEEEEIIPAFLHVNYRGIASLRQSENEDWNSLKDELEEWIGGNGVEVVRFTPALNALSKELGLKGRHLVFLVARNGYGDKTVGDNMPATILYGGGYPIYGNIVFALETDQGYNIEGFHSGSLLDKALNAINEAVDGLLRTE